MVNQGSKIDVGWSTSVLVSLVAACTSGCLPSNSACLEGTYSLVRWPPSYWVQPIPELEHTIAHAPPARFILVRSSKGVEAIRFLNVRAAPSEGDGYGCASYEVYGVPALRTSGEPASLRRSGQVSEFGVRGIHPFGYQPGQDRLLGTASSARYNYPTQIVVGDANEVAVTAWTSITDVDPANPRLKWFRYDQNGARTSNAVNFSEVDLP